jgi:hypothetical protein
MSKILDLEEHIMNCWTILEQIDTTLQIVDRTECDMDAVSNALIGIKQLYQTKFEVMFETFEEVVGEYYKKNKNTYTTTDNSTITTGSSEGSSTTITFR